jgi:hypothetical protein
VCLRPGRDRRLVVAAAHAGRQAGHRPRAPLAEGRGCPRSGARPMRAPATRWLHPPSIPSFSTPRRVATPRTRNSLPVRTLSSRAAAGIVGVGRGSISGTGPFHSLSGGVGLAAEAGVAVGMSETRVTRLFSCPF